MTFHKTLIQLLIFFFIAFVCLCLPSFALADEESIAVTSTSESSSLSVAHKIAIVERFYAKQEVGLDAIKNVFPPSWLNGRVDWEDEKRKIQQKLAQLKEANEVSENEANGVPAEVELLNLKLVWLTFSSFDREAIISSANSKQITVTAKENAQRTIKTATAAINEQEIQLQRVKQELVENEDERQSRLLSLQLELERQLEFIAKQSKQLGEAQISFSTKVNDWKDTRNTINDALEDEQFKPGTRNFSMYRQALHDKLLESNTLVQKESRFTQYYLGGPASLPDSIVVNVQTRETDTEKTIDLVNTLQRRRIDLSQSEEAFLLKRNELIVDFVQWHSQYRGELLETRGKLISQVIEASEFSLNNFDPLIVELKTLYSSFQFLTWKRSLTGEYVDTTSKAIKFYEITYLLKVIFIAALMIVLYQKRTPILVAAKRWCVMRSSNIKWRKMIVSAFGLLQELYVFLLIFIFADSIIKIIVGFGVDSAALVRPLVKQVLVFFLFWGLVKYLRPLLSLRQQIKQDAESTAAIEQVFSLLPQLYLVYWLVAGIVNIVLAQLLSQSLLAFHILNVLSVVFFILLLVLIWFRRSSWRSINDQAYNTSWWQNVCTSSRRKPWEPLILLVGGGIGVYRVAWKILSKHLQELEVTRSFQALVSRAILERQYRKTSIRLLAERFPDRYWRNFHFQTPAESHWYVERQQQEEQMTQAFDDWQVKNIPTRMLLCGDRGVGKSELISHFLRKQKNDCLHTYVGVGETAINDLCRKISISFLDESIDTPTELIEALLKIEPQSLCIENIENTILRKVGGFNTFATVLDIILQTSEKHLWIVTCTSYAWTIIQHGVPGANCFTEFVDVQGLDEAALGQALLTRHNDAHSSPPDFSELNLSSKNLNKSDVSELNQKSQELYFRILWDYTKGNPRQALYYWKASLAWSGEQCKVHLFEVPENNVLESLDDKALMLLAGLIEHNGLTMADIREIMNCSLATVRRLIEELTPFGLVFKMDIDGVTGWHVESFWTRAVENYLEKRQLLFRSKE